MVPGGGITTLSDNMNNAPRFEAGKPDQIRYRDALTEWTTMMNKSTKVDIKSKLIFDTIVIGKIFI